MNLINQGARKKGLCGVCGKVPTFDFFACKPCEGILKQTLSRTTSEVRSLIGACVSCGREKTKGHEHRLCLVCLDKSKKAYAVLKQKREAEGLCLRCGKNKATASKSRCGECAEKEVEEGRRYTQRKRIKKAEYMSPEVINNQITCGGLNNPNLNVVMQQRKRNATSIIVVYQVYEKLTQKSYFKFQFISGYKEAWWTFQDATECDKFFVFLRRKSFSTIERCYKLKYKEKMKGLPINLEDG